MYSALRNLLFQLPTEISHDFSLSSLSAAHRLRLLKLANPCPVSDPVELMGLTFPNRVGLAAGLDKNADHIDAMGALGFGFVEVGTVTPKAQDGNPTPRLFRLPKANAIINRMGFNNKGVGHLVAQTQKRQFQGILGINIGKNLATSVEDAAQDYLHCLREVYAHADYITINISSPNTPRLRDLQFGEQLKQLLDAIVMEREKLSDLHQVRVPLAVKIAPDIHADNLKLVAQMLVDKGIDSVIATNTTIARDAVVNLKHGEETGGLSGAPLTQVSTEVIRQLAAELKGELPIIGVGGIMSASDAVDKINAGASLVQIYTGFIYAGPSLIQKSATAIARQYA